MKTHNYSTCSAILLLVVSLFFSTFVAGQAMGADPRSTHAAAPSQAPARLVIRRMPNLGVKDMATLITVPWHPAGTFWQCWRLRGRARRFRGKCL